MRVPRAVSACRCAPRELNEHAEPIGALPRPTTARRIASSSTPPRSAAAAEAIAAGARTARARAARATGADRLSSRGDASRRSRPARARAASVDRGLRLHRSGHGTPQRAKVAARAASAGRRAAGRALLQRALPGGWRRRRHRRRLVSERCVRAVCAQCGSGSGWESSCEVTVYARVCVMRVTIKREQRPQRRKSRPAVWCRLSPCTYMYTSHTTEPDDRDSDTCPLSSHRTPRIAHVCCVCCRGTGVCCRIDVASCRE